MTKQKRSKIFYILNILLLILLVFDLFKVKSLLGDNYIINDNTFIFNFYKNIPLLSDMFDVFADAFGTSDFMGGCYSIFCINIVYWCVLCLPLDIIDAVKKVCDK